METQRGQVLLITLLVLSVAATVVLSAISRSTIDISVSTQIADSAKAFSAAEAGIEEVLKTGIVPTQPVVLAPGTTYNVIKTDIGGGTGIYTLPKKTSRGSVETVWLVAHNADGTIREIPTYTAPVLDICWSAETVIPAMIISVIYKTPTASYRVAKIAVDPSLARRSTNYFSSPTSASGGCGVNTGTTYRQTVTFASFSPAINPSSDILLMIRIQPVYSDTKIALLAVGALPSQGTRITSSGETTSGLSRKVVVYQQFRSPPVNFDAVVFTTGAITH